MAAHLPRIVLSWGSGKDSAWMLHRLRLAATHEIAGLMTTINQTAGRVSMHGVRIELLDAQARAAGLPLWTIPLPYPCTNEIYEEAMRRFLDILIARGMTHLAFGDLFLEDVRRYREDRLEGTGISPVFPLWGMPTADLADEMVEAGLKARLATVDPRVLDPSFAGREYDRALLADLPPSVDPCGERGEFHTFVYQGPMFSEPIPVETGDVVVRDGFVFADLTLPRMPDALASVDLDGTVAHRD